MRDCTREVGCLFEFKACSDCIILTEIAELVQRIQEFNVVILDQILQ